MPIAQGNTQFLKGLICPEGTTQVDYQISGHDGLTLRVSKTGLKTWRATYHIFGKRKIVSLGIFGSNLSHLSLKQASIEAARIRSQARQGIDVGDKKKKRIQAAQDLQSRTTRTFVEARLSSLRQQNRADSYIESTRRAFERHILPLVGDDPLETVTSEDISPPFDDFAEAGKATSHNALLRTWRAMVNEADIPDVMRKRKFLHTNVKTARFDLSEIVTLKHALGDPSSLDRGLATRAVDFALTTIVRSGTVAMAKIEDIDFEAKVWRIPAEDLKTNLPYMAPLNERAVLIAKTSIELARKQRSETPYLFPHRFNEAGFIRQDSIYQLWSRLKVDIGLDQNSATLHSIRHTAVTELAMRGVSTDICDKILQHRHGAALSRIARIYQGADFLPQRRDALDLWGDLLASQTVPAE